MIKMTQYYNSINNFENIEKYILKGRSKVDRKVANNTIARIEGDKIIIKYHSSDIAELTENTRKLYSDGYKTYTTKERLNWYIPAPYSLYQDRGVWYIWNYQNKSEYIFDEGLTFNKINDQWIIDPDSCADKSQADKIKRIRNQINKYTNQYVKKLTNGELESPDAGDCWHCYMSEVESGDSLGEVTENIDHLESHFDEKYYVPSMLMNAIKFYPMSLMANSVLHNLWFNPLPENDNLWLLDILKDQAKSSLRKFLQRQFKIG